MTNEEKIVEGLMCCSYHYCHKCPYTCDYYRSNVAADALDLIRLLRVEIACLKRKPYTKDEISDYVVGIQSDIEKAVINRFINKMKETYKGFDEENETISLDNLIVAMESAAKEVMCNASGV